MNKFNIMILSASLILVGACTEALNVEPTSVITTNNFWRTEEDANGALMGMYVELRNLSQGLHQLGEHRSEVMTPGLFGEGVFILHRNEMNADTPGHPDWSGFYRAINTANLILKNVPTINFASDARKNNVIAQAYAMRAYLYFTMTKTWGDLILRTEPTEGFGADVTLREREPQSVVLAQIKQDIEQALQLFPDHTFSSGRAVWSKAATHALKGDVYLWTARRMGGGNPDLNIALEALNQVEQADVGLLENFEDVFRFENKGNREILMSIRHQDLEPGNYLWFMWIIGAAAPSNIDQETRERIFPIGGGQGLMVLHERVRNQFTNDDTRRDATFFEIETIEPDGSRTYLTNIQQKFQGTIIGGNRVFLSDPIIYRYADVLLMKAEAKNALGQDPSHEINLIRQRAYKDNFDAYAFVNGDQGDNDSEILKERLLELVLEGKRWWDLVRFGKAFDLVPALQNRADQEHLLLFPISNTVLSQEPLVVQNPGY